MRHPIASVLVALFPVTAAGLAVAQAYPERPVRVIVPFPPGGNVDVFSRVLFRHVEDELKQTVVIENQGGANAILGAELLKNATPDGYTYMNTSFGLAVNKFIVRKLPFDLEKDFLAAKSGHMKKCMADALLPYCDAQATGKKLHGAARTSFMNKCQTD